MPRLFLLVGALAACGDDGHHAIPDAPVIPDGAPDASPTPVTVTITRGGQPTVGAKVYFQNADSSLVAAASTDATGTASHVMDPGGYVTTIEAPGLTTFGISDSLHTWAGVKPGDQLVLRQNITTGISVTVTIPTDGAHGAVTDYLVSSTCGGGTLTPPVGSAPPPQLVKALSFTCASADLIVVARDATQGALSSFFMSGAALVDLGTLDLHASTYDAAITRSYTYSNYPDPAVNLQITDAYLTTRGVVYERNITHVGDVATNMAAMPKPFTGALELIVTTEPANGSYTTRHFLDWQPPGDYTADFGSKLVQDYSSIVTIDATHKITWTEIGGAQQADFSQIRFFSSHTTRAWSWQVLSPGSPSIQLPTLPTDLFDYNYAAADPFSVSSLDIFKMPGGYDGARATMFAIENPGDLITGTTGTISGNSWAPPP